MNIRVASVEDIERMHFIRMAVKENVLNTPGLVTHNDYVQMLTQKGRGWVCEENSVITGFAIVDAERRNVWALFVHPESEKRGVGRLLHDKMISWAKEQKLGKLWLTTDPGTRAESVYKKAGWKENGKEGREIRFEYSL
jgi:GNAT superfamily N-acetyltransferase